MNIKSMVRGFMPQEMNQKRNTTTAKESQPSENGTINPLGKGPDVSGMRVDTTSAMSIKNDEATATTNAKSSGDDGLSWVLGYNNDGSEIVYNIQGTMQTAGQDTLFLSQEALDSLKDKSESLLDMPIQQPSNSNQDIVGNYTGTYDKNSEDTTFPTFDKVDKPSLDNQAEFEAWHSDFVKTNADTTEALTNAINQIFKDNGIEVPEGVALNFSVDPYDYAIHVSFNSKETGEKVDFLTPEMEQKIEDALNQGDNGKNLYEHILYSNQNVNDEFSGESYDWNLEVLKGEGAKKVFDLVKDYTGYDVRDLVAQDGKLLTPEGEDVWELMTEKYAEVHGDDHDYGKQVKEMEILKSTRYEDIINLGWESQLHSNMTIMYKDGELSDFKPTY